jgi:pyruvyltransferase
MRGIIRVSRYIDEDNIGDKFIENFFDKMGQKIEILDALRINPKAHIMGPGSILAFGQENSIIFGSGFISENEMIEASPLKIIGVRGNLSAEKIRKQLSLEAAVISDPGLLVSEIILKRKSQAERENLYIPHVSDSSEVSQIIARKLNSTVLPPTGNVDLFLQKISEARIVYSRSLHGLVFADAYMKPRIWVEPSTSMKGTNFKFLDYHSSLNENLNSINPFTDTLKEINTKCFQISQNKLDYMQSRLLKSLEKLLQFYKSNSFKSQLHFWGLNVSSEKAQKLHSQPGWKHLPGER